MTRTERLDYDSRIKKAILEDYRIIDTFLNFVPTWAKKRFVICQDKTTDEVISKKSVRSIARIFQTSSSSVQRACECLR